MQRSRQHASRDGFEFAIGIAERVGVADLHADRACDGLTIGVGLGKFIAHRNGFGTAERVSNAHRIGDTEPEPDGHSSDVVR